MALSFTDVSGPGITRRRAGRGWCFVGADGAPVRCAETRARLLGLALPPAYTQAWYNPDPNGHIQAYGIDARGRRQYRYHPDFRAHREADKFASLAAFGEALPAIRLRVEAELRRRSPCRDHVVAAVVRLLDLGHLRVGNEQYARANRSFGATTLRARHARVEGERVMLRFRGKGGREQRLELADRTLARTVRRCQELPGQHLFAWEDPDGGVHPVSSSDVNAFLREAGGPDLTARQFRTWWASVLALEQRLAVPGAGVRAVSEAVAERLGNTPAIARKSYIHPAIFDAVLVPPPRPGGPRALAPAERRLMGLLRQAAEPAADAIVA